MVSDAPIQKSAQDRLDFGAYAEALAGLIHNPETGTPLTIAVNAPWGAGKSSLARLVEEKLGEKAKAAGRDPHVVCWFNAWMHDDADHLQTALVAEVARTADRQRSWWTRFWAPLPSTLRQAGSRRRHRALRRAAAVLGLTIAFASAIVFSVVVAVSSSAETPPSGLSPVLWGLLATFATSLATTLRTMREVANSIGAFVASPADGFADGSVKQVREELGDLIAEATPPGARFVVVVDDLERCRPPMAVDVLEGINQLLCHSGVVVLVLADMETVASAVEIKYASLAHTDPGSGSPTTQRSRFGRHYLQKIVHLQFDLPRHAPERMHAFLRQLASEPVEPPQAPRPLDALREALTPLRDPLRVAWQPAPPRLPKRVALRAVGLDQRLASWAARLACAALLPFSWSLWQAMRLSNPPPLRLTETPPRSVPHRVALQVAGALYLLFLAGLLAMLVAPLFVSALLDDEVFGPIVAGLGAGLAILIGLVPTSLGFILQRQDTLRLRAHHARIDAALRGRQPTLPPPPDVPAPLWSAMVRERRQALLAAESRDLARASDQLVQHHPMLPRNATRLLNRLRLLLFIAAERRMLEEGNLVTADHLGKWAVLQERWPEAAQAILSSPAAMSAWEAAAEAGREALAREAARLLPDFAIDEGLRHLLVAQPRLGPVMEGLVAFQPVPSPAEVRLTPTTPEPAPAPVPTL
ncbi:MAG TPA: P-loop NTPase fold protein [Candidatus Thermoplasmatota archaeon]|nr:P-loop NTPase fold protein [Candidatus Thermoplasmatota archaeon]